MDPKRQRREEEEKKRREEDARIFRAVGNSIKNIFKRQMKIDDNCLRYCMFVDKLSMTLDILTAFLNTMVDREEYPEDLRLDILQLSNLISEELENLMNYCRSPSYSPDAPFGQHLVKSTSFYENANKNDN